MLFIVITFCAYLSKYLTSTRAIKMNHDSNCVVSIPLVIPTTIAFTIGSNVNIGCKRRFADKFSNFINVKFS